MTVDKPVIHGGNVYEMAERLGCAADEILDFSANINPLGFPDGVRDAISQALDMSIHYPDPKCTKLTHAISATYGCPAEQTIVANGTTEIFYLLPKALGRRKAVIPTPCYVDYIKSAALGDMEIEFVTLREEDDFAVDWNALGDALNADEVVYLGRPNNPTGTTFGSRVFLEFAQAHPENVFVLDQAYADFAEDEVDIVQNVPANVIVALSLTKFFAVPGLRLGFAVAPEPFASDIRRLIPPWSVNNLAQAAGVAMLQDHEYATATRRLVREQRASMVERLDEARDLKIYPGVGNFLFMRSLRPNLTATMLAEALLKRKIAIRVCDNYEGLDETYVRIAVKSKEANDVIVAAIQEFFANDA